MNQLRVALFILISTFAFGANAAVSGLWTGTGEWTYQGQGTDCPAMSLRFLETDTEFKRVSGFFDCGIVALHSDPFTWSKVGGDLFFNNSKAGRVTETSFETLEPYADDVTIETKLSAQGKNADYQEIWRGKDGREIYVIRGKFVNKN
jgi:hypothetical protein